MNQKSNPILKITLVQQPYLNPFCEIVRYRGIRKYHASQSSVKRLQRALWMPVCRNAWTMRPLQSEHVGWKSENLAEVGI